MPTYRGDEAPGTRCRRRLPRGAVGLMLALAAMAALPGCGGCSKDPAETQKQREKREAEQRAKEKEKPKPDFELSRLATRPSSGKPGAGREVLGPPYKPGHWTAATLLAKTNNFDFVGELEIAATNQKGDGIPLDNAPFDLATSRQLLLPKRQPKVFESILFVPSSPRQALVSYRLNWSKGGRRAWENRHRLAPMPSYQYHFVVLTRWPERYTYLAGLASVEPPSDEFGGNSIKPYYRVTLIRADQAKRRPWLPSYGLLWTSIACVLWDDANPDALSPSQQQAMLDWLHWGGQLILSGPDTLDSLADGFLSPYLPATASGVRKLGPADFEALAQWSGKSLRPLGPLGEWTGVELKQHPKARSMPDSGGLLVDRRVGRGRIVVSAFRLSGRELTSTRPALDELFNAFLLGRKPRAFADQDSPDFVDESGQSAPLVNWADGHNRLDAARICKLRYFVRDTGLKLSDYGADVLQQNQELAFTAMEESPPGPGLAAWNDSGPVAQTARLALKSAAQIEIPDRRFVLWILGGYLVVLVPCNWALFRLLGRVEWAWIAAPVIAIVSTGFVIRAAELDIGFARSRTEIAVVEIQGDYPRAHVTRYTALYTSLTTEYDFHFDDPGALAQPFAGFGRASDHRGLVYHRGKSAVLEDHFVRSHSTGGVHSEAMVELGGSLSLRKIGEDQFGAKFEVVNHTKLTLHDAGVIRKDDAGNLQTAWVGLLEPGKKKSFDFPSDRAASRGSSWLETQRGNSVLTGIGVARGELNLRALTGLAQDPAHLEPGQMRLVAALEEEIPGPTIDPSPPQSQVAALVVAHLQFGHGEDPEPDANTPRGRMMNDE